MRQLDGTDEGQLIRGPDVGLGLVLALGRDLWILRSDHIGFVPEVYLSRWRFLRQVLAHLADLCELCEGSCVVLSW